MQRLEALQAGAALQMPASQAFVADAVNGGERFGHLYRQLEHEVRQFIARGDSAPAGGIALSPEGWWQRQGEAARMAADAAGDAASRAGESVGDGVDEGEAQAFAARLRPLAQQAAARLGVDADVLLAQAALETGWGRRPLRKADGGDSHNLFAIKAGAAWAGQSLQAATHEVEQGQWQARVDRFRSYDSPAESFDDLARLLAGQPRYRAALGRGADARSYGQALQAGGYATDPAYADKLDAVWRRLQGAAR